MRSTAAGRAAAAPPNRQPSSPLVALTRQVAAYADEGASPFEIAQRTGLAHDAIDLILHFRRSREAEGSIGAGSVLRADPGPHRWIADA